METNFSKYDNKYVKGNKGWGIPITLALATGLLCYGWKILNNPSKYNPKPETRIVSQDSGLEELTEYEGGMK
jgi:hypothetical protein